MANYQPLFYSPGGFITHLMKAGFKRYGPVTADGEFETHYLDLTSLNLDVGILAPFLISKKLSGHQIVTPGQFSGILADLDKATRSLQKKLVVLTIGGKLTPLEKQIMDDLRVLGVAIMDRSTIEAVYASDDWAVKAQIMSAALVRFLGREFLSPYVSGRPAIGGRFFGRASLVNRIIPSSGNFTIVGNRRIGKTSLLKEIKERLKLQNVRTAEIYGATCASTQDVVYKLLQNLERFREAERVLAEPQRARNLANYVQGVVTTEKRSVAVFIDEVDRILEFDARQDYEVLHLLRETFEGNQYCRVFIAGFRKLLEVRQSINAPLFNFTTLLELPLFSREETYEMVTNPLRRLAIEVANTDLPAAIYRDTGGHPELIQIHCAAVVRYVQSHDRVPTGADLFSEVFDTQEYKQKVLGTFLANTNPYEALSCYLLFADAEKSEHPVDYEFGPKDLVRVTKQTGINLGITAILTLITQLQVSGIITAVTGTTDRYRFSAPQLVNYCGDMDLDFCIEESLELVRQLESDKSGKRDALRKRFNIWTEEDTSDEELLVGIDWSTGARSESVVGRPIKHVYFLPGGGAIVTEPEGVTTLTGSVGQQSVDDLNLRCLEMVDQWTNHKTFEQRLRGIGNQLSDSLKIGIPELSRHFKMNTNHGAIVITSEAEGLRIPFELLPIEKSHLATVSALSRRITNYQLPPQVQLTFQHLIASLTAASGRFRALLVSSDAQETVGKGENELRAVKQHIESGCERIGLNCEIVLIPSSESNSKRLEAEFLSGRPCHLFHFTGHGRHFSEDSDASGIVLNREDDEPEVVSCKRLKSWFKGTNLLLAYISSCHSSAASGSGIGLSSKYVGTIEAIVAAGVPNVVGFRWAVSDQSAFHLADEFYRQLFEVQAEKNLSLAMLEARRAVERRPDFFDAWASSMLITQYS